MLRTLIKFLLALIAGLSAVGIAEAFTDLDPAATGAVGFAAATLSAIFMGELS